MSLRKPHRKSRNGCMECKRRRVKCNEQYPCHNCLKYQTDCIFRTDLAPQRRSPTEPGKSFGNANQIASKSVIGAMESLAGSSPSTTARRCDFEARDLELMHHYSTSVAKTFSRRIDIQDVWAIALPKHAYSCSYLMHGLLAISALHSGWLNHDSRHDYTNLSTYHLHKFIALFREQLANISIENCVPLFGASSLMVIYVCAQSALVSQPMEKDSLQIKMIMNIFSMCRGVETILAPYRGEVHQSTLSSLLHKDYSLVGDPSSQHDNSPSREPQFFELQRLITNQKFESSELNEYLDALAKLKTAFNFMDVASKPLEAGAAFVWPIMLQRGFMSRFTQQTPLSLVLLAHYCVILYQLDGYWFLNGWYRSILAEIKELLPLEFQAWISWPREVCGLAD
ncbi:unnamed protein product [Penicillium salamii]|uniref:Zn(2)-C6 fungal-type domain-containing protein n=1 Tax=Penicillium salamii TaxID=1612424 RepID=A0A9W4JCI7_9EURO|nr:unnamed protein product [Penicillium salamii]CAG7985731.1 unnamed protein product [Penicillium salamii]CAG8077575.1 unnamed protein product [Penicillium salamii]CAG8249885.1 unnamed protein product [Penicillium salamii]CAG8285405.1 unnamed protein product [Penicillium salamii]